MEDRMRYMLLRVLSVGGDIDSLEKAGYQYADIAREYSKIINDGLIVVDKELRFIVSEKGYEALKHLEEKINKSG